MNLPESKAEDPDAQATITEFLDYTEYLPSDITRALGLIRNLDRAYLHHADRVHLLAKQYGALPELESDETKAPSKLRRDLAAELEHAIRSREAAYVEALRLHEMVRRHHSRLVGIRAKLTALPKPPSRDPTPVPLSPLSSRKSPPPRITLRLDRKRLSTSAIKPNDKDEKKSQRHRRITVPGEVLPPPNPDSPQALSDSEWNSIPTSPLPIPTGRVGGPRGRHQKLSLMNPSQAPNLQKEKPPRIPGQGTNVHSAVAGISTSNALSLIPKPPADAQLGSEHAPWMRLTEYEMAVLRKRMKKNAVWTPSETMIRRELADAGRGPDNYKKLKSKAESHGDEVLDVDNVTELTPGKPLAPGEISAESLSLASTQLSNRGMKSNEAKKEKRKAMLMASLHETQQAARRFHDLGSNFKDLFKKSSPVALSSPLRGLAASGDFFSQNSPSSVRHDRIAKRKGADTSHANSVSISADSWSGDKRNFKKRKTEESNSSSNQLSGSQSARKNKARNGSSEEAESALDSDNNSPRTRRVSLTLRGPATPSLDHAERKSSRPLSRRTSKGPPSAILPDEPGRKVTSRRASTDNGKNLTAAARRSKRPIPASITQGQAAKMDRPSAPAGANANEPRYCICDDVSYGDMIGCDNDTCEREWFHFRCVGLTENPPRRNKWYCPDCRQKIK